MVDTFAQIIPASLYMWDDRTLYVGGFRAPLHIAYGVAALIVSLGESFNLDVGNHKLKLRSALLPAGISATISAESNPVAIVHLDALGKDYRRLGNAFEHRFGRIITQLKQEELYILRLKGLYFRDATFHSAHEILDQLLLESFSQYNDECSVDDRIFRVADFIRSHYKCNTPIDELSCLVGLSPSRLSHLFKVQTGVPIRRFRLWYRLYQSVFKINEGNCLTDAALASGFSDLSHYSNTFYSMWGLNPSALFLGDNGAKIKCCRNNACD